jgi:DNA-binding transcriptional ArsR family regulator
MPHPLSEGSEWIDAAALRALAHPLRIQLLDLLAQHESATATMLAREVGESSGATSYHLRQLARHGLIEEDVERGTAKERWWRPVPGGLTLVGHEFMAAHDTRAAARIVIGEIHRGRIERLQHWLDTALTDWSTEWIESTVDSHYNLRLNPAQTRQLVGELHDMLERYRALPPGEGDLPVEIQLNVFPKADPGSQA